MMQLQTQEEQEEEIKVFRFGGTFKSNQRKLEVCLTVSTPTWSLWKDLMVPYILGHFGRKLSGTEPKGAQERIIQDYVDLLPHTI